MSKIKYRSAEAIKRRRTFFVRVAIVIFFVCAVVVFGLVYTLRLDRFQIHSVVVSDANILKKEDVEQAAQTMLSGSYVWVIPKTNTFLFSASSAEKKLIEQFPAIQSLNVARDGMQSLTIDIVERKPHVLWCAPHADDKAEECYFADTTGLIFSRAPYFSGGVYFIYRGGIPADTALGSYILPSQKFEELERFVAQINALHMNVSGVTIKEEGDFDLELTSNVHLLCSGATSYDDTLSNISALLKSDTFATSTLSSLEYIDMRFGNKVYLKKKENK